MALVTTNGQSGQKSKNLHPKDFLASDQKDGIKVGALLLRELNINIGNHKTISYRKKKKKRHMDHLLHNVYQNFPLE